MSETKRWVCITGVENVPLREGRSVQVGGRDVAIFNLGDRFLSIENRCPHKGGPLAEGIVSGTTVVCPLHAWKVNLETGTVVSNSDLPSCVEAYPTLVKDGFIFLELPAASKANEMKPGVCLVQENPASWLGSNALAGDGSDAKNIAV